eukprot:COSAG01_NODE_49935_length_368_cov_0.490706_2_plen_23_part_01
MKWLHLEAFWAGSGGWVTGYATT